MNIERRNSCMATLGSKGLRDCLDDQPSLLEFKYPFY